jgi:hypothetical protein
MTANAPFKHTQPNYTPTASPHCRNRAVWFMKFKQKWDSSPKESLSKSSVCTGLLGEQKQAAAGIEVNRVLRRLQDRSRLPHRVAGNRDVLQVRDTRTHGSFRH